MNKWNTLYWLMTPFMVVSLFLMLLGLFVFLLSMPFIAALYTYVRIKVWRMGKGWSWSLRDARDYMDILFDYDRTPEKERKFEKYP